MKEIKSLINKTASIIKGSKGPGLSSIRIAEYNLERGKINAKYICHAPFSNMYFNVHGDCAPCWLTFQDPDSYPSKSIREIWFGEKFQNIRDNIKNYDLTYKCNVCLKNLQNKNFTSVLSRAYDSNEIKKYPTMMELELSNTCNLECVMCIGELSSSIRKNRENLPPLISPYDEAFVNQLEEFIPHLNELRINGGEPFLIPLTYSIFEKVEKLKPNLKIVIATNGTVFNNKVKSWLEKLNININFSLDSLTKTIYEEIRVNAKFDKVIENFHAFNSYSKKTKRILCIMVNPMRNNWHEMPEFIRFANNHKVNIWFNTIHRPTNWAIWSLPSKELETIYNKLSQIKFVNENDKHTIAKSNIKIYNGFAKVQLKNWWEESIDRENINDIIKEEITEEKATSIIKAKIKNYVYLNFDEGEEQKSLKLNALYSKLDSIKQKLSDNGAISNFYILVFNSNIAMLVKELETKSEKILYYQFLEDFKV
jgi:molybdenum cofactor biosynthesis enzyme MoaA